MILVALFTFLSVSAFAGPSLQADPAAAQQANALIDKIQEKKQVIEESDSKQRRILSGLFELNKKIKKSVNHRSQLQGEKSALEESIAILEEKILSLKEQNRQQRIHLAKRLRAIYKHSDQNVVKSLFSATSAADLERNLRILGIVAKKDISDLQAYSLSLKELSLKKSKLSGRLTKLQQTEKKLIVAENNLNSELKLKTKILDNVKKSRTFALSEISKIRNQGAHFNLEDSGVADMLLRPSFQEARGQLPWPVRGKVVQGFGTVKLEKERVSLSHRGTFIAARPSEVVKAVFSGRVAFSGHLPGFDHTVIVDHGDHYYSVYSHLRPNLQVMAGQEIDQGVALGQVAYSDWHNNFGTYFEIRHFSEPYDPTPWMKGTPL